MNFEYLKSFSELKKLYEYCAEAEEFCLCKPNISATAARKAMEFIVKLLYATLTGDDDGLTVFEMVTSAEFSYYINDESLISAIHYIRKMGNVAVHDGSLNTSDSLSVLEQLHFLAGEFCVFLKFCSDYPKFINPATAGAKTLPTPTKADEKKAEESAAAKVAVEPEIVAKFAARMRNTVFDVKYKRDESENKQLYTKASLREAGWPIVNVPNQAMPCSVGINMLLDSGDTVDFVIYGRDNKPLAIIDYSTTKENILEGRLKAIKKAEEMSKKLGYKPIVYYTTGYQIFIIDQLGYPPRRVFQYHSIEELELMKLRATMRKDIRNPIVDDNIANRKYQKEAIAATCNAFASNRRSSLLVMATGTGKTRMSIALVDILMRANWVKNVLFLADRTSLVHQAHKNFTKLLPSVTTSIYAGSSMNKDPNARIIFSTYQTMINLINDDTREFGIGRFDLIIIDEAHRSIFNKYSALFHYFDALMIGLTATPRREENKSTYEMFGLENGKPDYAYELEQAIKDKFLVGFSVLNKTTDAMRRGIRYDDLSAEEKEKYEDTFATGDESIDRNWDYNGTVLDAKILHKKEYINLGTIDAMLNDLMKNGLKINAGDKIGKTIIFASSHTEAEKIVERFQQLYPHLGLDFCKLIDSQVENNLALIDSFGERDQLPQIAVSVDMMDTGIDVPDILNLVFFKGVGAKIKFLQMIGRGTRLCPNIYGPGINKEGFLIFDYYDNFNFFSTTNTWSTVDQNTNGEKLMRSTPQSVLINSKKLEILRDIIDFNLNTPFDIKYKQALKNYFISTTRGLCNDDIEVNHNMAYVSKYRTAQQWDSFTDAKIEEIEKIILPLFPSEQAPAKVKVFDLMMYVIEAEVPKRLAAAKDITKIRHGFGNVGKKIDEMLEKLKKLKTIPEIVKKEELISKMHEAKYIYDDFSLERCEYVRKELRDLMAYIPDDQRYYILETSDFVIDSDFGGGVTREKTYREKAQEYIAKGGPIFAKLSNLDELTQDEKDELENVFNSKLGTPADYAAWSNNKPLLPFLRMQVGIFDKAIETKFGSFLNSTVLTPKQLTYMNQIISYARENGDITFTDLQRVSPFCDEDIMSLFGTNVAHVKTLVKGLHDPVK